jgi:RNA-directed DNA polymerase
MPNSSLLRVLAGAFLAGESTVEAIVSRAQGTLGRPWRWLRPLAQRFVAAYGGGTRPRRRDVVRFLREDLGFSRSLTKYRHELSVDQWLTEAQQMQPAGAAATWVVPAIESTAALADWLMVDAAELEWFADLKGLGCGRKIPARIKHYHYRALTKRSGTIRLIEAPKPRLKQLQRRILALILDKIPSHPAAHGFIQGRFIGTFAAPHAGQRVVLRMDLRDFFPSISGARIQSFFRTAGYPESVADRLGGICTNAAPQDAWKVPAFDVDPLQLREAQVLYARPHLPQGAPTSPALANLCFYRADCRLKGLAKSAGAVYTRYADDLAFSGGEAFERCAARFSTHVAAILREEGFATHHRKTRIMRQGVRQHLAGLVTNQRVNVIRADFDRVKAILTNCIRFGPESQNRDAHPRFRLHLEGRVNFVETIHAARGKRLRNLLEQIEWH